MGPDATAADNGCVGPDATAADDGANDGGVDHDGDDDGAAEDDDAMAANDDATAADDGGKDGAKESTVADDDADWCRAVIVSGCLLIVLTTNMSVSRDCLLEGASMINMKPQIYIDLLINC